MHGIGVAPAGSKVWVNQQPATMLDAQPGPRIPINPYLEVMAKEHETIMLCGGLETKLHLLGNRLFVFNISTSSPSTQFEMYSQGPDGASLNSTTSLYLHQPKAYSITIDDVADNFAEIAKAQPASLFDHPFFQRLQQLHQAYGAVFSLYLFQKGTLHNSFELSQMPATYRQEFQENAFWLHLGFHAQKMMPQHPYKSANAQTASRDALAVQEQIRRFAGQQSLDPITRIHYWSGSLESCRAWLNQGIKGFYAAPAGRQAYYLEDATNALLAFHDAWYDAYEGILFLQTDIWLEHDVPTTKNPEEATARILEEYLSSHPLAQQNMQLFTHEAFLLSSHASKHQTPEKMAAAIKWLTQHGYQPRFDAGIFLDNLPPVQPHQLEVVSQRGQQQLTWQHQVAGCSYRISRKTLSSPQDEWQLIGESREKFWNLDATAARYAYRVIGITSEGKQSTSQPLIMNPSLQSKEITLTTYPNPFNQQVMIQYVMPTESRVSITMHNLLGQTLLYIPAQHRAAGQHWQEINTEGWASGLYFVRLQTENQSAIRKVMLVK